MKRLTNDKFGFILLIINIFLLTISISYFSYSLILLKKIETLLRIFVIFFFIILAVIFIVFIIRFIFKKKRIKLVIITLFTLIISCALLFVGHTINKLYSSISSITTNTQSYSASIVARIDSSMEKIEDIKGFKIGIINDTESIDGYQIPQEIIKDKKLDNELVEYNNYIELINGLLDEEIDLAFLPTNYHILFSSIQGMDKLNEKTKIIYTKDKNIKAEKTLNTKNIDEPFTILLMGVDALETDIKGSSFNGDSLMLITFNPKTLNTTMLSIPRDSYVSITCFAGQKKNKITHAAWYGESCMMSTIEKMFNVKIDYYVKINFRGVVNIVDALGGIDVNVPYSMCEQNSLREFGDSMIYLKKGPQTLNGEQALALSRNRHGHRECGPEYNEFEGNDFVRGQNQQLVIQGMLNKLKYINSIDTFYDMLNSISQSMETNMSTENILSFYNIAKDILIKNTSSNTDLASLIGIQRLYLSGYDKTIIDYDSNTNSGSKLALYNFVPYQGSINDISRAMKINLGLLNDEPIKSFDFDINVPYEEHVIGKGRYNEGGIALLPSFVGRSLSEAQSYCSARGIPLNVEKIETISSSFDGLVSTQSLPAGMDVAFVSRSKGLSVSVYEYKKKDDTTVKKTEKDDDKEKKKESDNSNTINNPDDNQNGTDNQNNGSNNNQNSGSGNSSNTGSDNGSNSNSNPNPDQENGSNDINPEDILNP